MGNCYSAESNTQIETDLQNTTVARRHKVDFSSADQFAEGNLDSVDLDAQEGIIIADAAAKIHTFINGLTSSEYYN